MLDIRLHVIMGHASASLWCTSHGPAHCLWSARVWLEQDSQIELLDALRLAALEVYQRAVRGELDDLSDECGV